MTTETRIGPAAYESLPAQVEVDGEPYWLIRPEAGGYLLLSALCPHAGGEVRAMEGTFFCPLHFWTFDLEDGTCTNMPGERLIRRGVEERDGELYAVGERY